MEIGVSQSIFTQKNTTGSMGPGYSSTKKWYIFLGWFSDISRCGDTFHSPLVSGFPLLYFIPILPATIVYKPVTKTWVNNTPCNDHHQEFFFWYTSISLMSEWYPQRYELLIAMECYLYTISTHFDELTELIVEIWISPSIYISKNPKELLRWILSF